MIIIKPRYKPHQYTWRYFVLQSLKIFLKTTFRIILFKSEINIVCSFGKPFREIYESILICIMK